MENRPYLPWNLAHDFMVEAFMAYGVPEDDAEICVDVMLLKRIFDNIFSNIGKYADFEKPVKAVAKNKGDYILIKFKNTVNKNNKHVESTKIGIKTCARLCDAMGMTYSYSSQNGFYITKITIPVIADETGE